MDVCVLTGADSDGGVSLARLLVERGFRVYGLVEEQKNWGFEHSDFVPLVYRGEDRHQIEAMMRAVLEHEKNIFAVVHLARSFSSQNFQELDADRIEPLVFRNLTLPLLVNKVLLPGVIQEHGHLIQCCTPIGKGPRIGGTLYLSLEEGLQRFYRRLYEEVRPHGVRVTCVRPYGLLGTVTHDQDPSQIITGEFLAASIMQVLVHGEGSFFSDLEIRPEPPIKVAGKVRPVNPINMSAMRLPPPLDKETNKKSFMLPARKSMAPKKKLEWADRPIDYGPAPEVYDDDDDDLLDEEVIEKNAPRSRENERSRENDRERPGRQQHQQQGRGHHREERDRNRDARGEGQGRQQQQAQAAKPAQAEDGHVEFVEPAKGSREEVTDKDRVIAKDEHAGEQDLSHDHGDSSGDSHEGDGEQRKRRRRRRRRGRGRGDREEGAATSQEGQEHSDTEGENAHKQPDQVRERPQAEDTTVADQSQRQHSRDGGHRNESSRHSQAHRDQRQSGPQARRDRDPREQVRGDGSNASTQNRERSSSGAQEHAVKPASAPQAAARQEAPEVRQAPSATPTPRTVEGAATTVGNQAATQASGNAARKQRRNSGRKRQGPLPTTGSVAVAAIVGHGLTAASVSSGVPPVDRAKVSSSVSTSSTGNGPRQQSSGRPSNAPVRQPISEKPQPQPSVKPVSAEPAEKPKSQPKAEPADKAVDKVAEPKSGQSIAKPTEKPEETKPAAKKVAAKKTVARKTAAKKATVKKVAAKKTTTKKVAAKKAVAKKAATKSGTAEQPVLPLEE